MDSDAAVDDKDVFCDHNSNDIEFYIRRRWNCWNVLVWIKLDWYKSRCGFSESKLSKSPQLSNFYEIAWVPAPWGGYGPSKDQTGGRRGEREEKGKIRGGGKSGQMFILSCQQAEDHLVFKVLNEVENVLFWFQNAFVSLALQSNPGFTLNQWLHYVQSS